MVKKKEPSFEESLERLEEIVKHMESSDISLAEILSSYTEGVQLSQRCQKELESVEKAMDLMIRTHGEEIQELELKIEGD